MFFVCWRVLFSSYIVSFFASFCAYMLGRFLLRFWCYFRRLLGLQIDNFSVLYRVLFSFVFCIDFCSILAPIWGSFGRPWGVQVGHFGHRFLDYFWMYVRMRMHTDPPRAHALAHTLAHGPPVRTHMRTDPPRPPKTTKKWPRQGQERPRAAQERQQEGNSSKNQ